MSNTRFFWGALFALSLSQPSLAEQNCDYATDLLINAFYLYHQGGDVSQQKLLFYKSLDICYNNVTGHYALGSIFNKQGKYAEAIDRYKQALKLHPKFLQSWYGLGVTYYKQERFLLSLEAFSHVCKINETAKEQIISLLEDDRLTFSEKDKVIDQENLLVLYHSERYQRLKERLFYCKLGQVELQPIYAFSNLSFDTTKATLGAGANQQLDEIVAALQQTQDSQIINIHGHTDRRRFLNTGAAESDQRNLQLSQERAAAIATALAQRGISKTRLKIFGHGSKRPFVRDKSEEALATNRRIEIEVKPIVKKSEDDIDSLF